MLRFMGCGLPNVFLADGYHEIVFDDGVAYSYSDIGKLHLEIGRSVSMSKHALSPDECRFLRKQLSLTQDELGQLLGKTGQAVAKWEKGEAGMPRPDGLMLRLAWLNFHSPSDVTPFVATGLSGQFNTPVDEYIFSFSNGVWKAIPRRVTVVAVEICEELISKARSYTPSTSEPNNWVVQ